MNTKNDALYREIMKLKRKLRRGASTPGSAECRPPKRERILSLLLSFESGVRQKQLCEMTGVGAPAMSETIDRLKDDDYIDRILDADDRRATRIILTEKGREKAYEIRDTHAEHVNELFKNLDEDEKEQLIFLIKKITE